MITTPAPPPLGRHCVRPIGVGHLIADLAQSMPCRQFREATGRARKFVMPFGHLTSHHVWHVVWCRAFRQNQAARPIAKATE